MLVFSLLFSLLLCGSSRSLDPKEDCGLDHDHSLPILEPCLEKGEQFVQMFYKKMIKGKKYTHKCRNYEEFRECVRTAESQCPHQVKLILDTYWTDVINTMECHCNESSHVQDACTDRLPCVEDELGGLFAERCEDYHQFNSKQKTRHHCHFKQHELECKHRLVSTACGESAGDFSTALSQIEAKRDTCHLTRPRNSGREFGYSEQCPRNLTAYVQVCATEAFSIKRRIIYFLDNNDLIADHRKKEVRRACSRFKIYRECISPWEEKCSQGMQHLFDTQQANRNYMLKMKYICLQAKHDYYDHISCYKRTEKNGTLQQCLPIWTEVMDHLKNLTAVDFYCNTSSTRHLVIRKLDELRECYESRYAAFCGDEAGKTMGNFIKAVITDPYYLRYKFYPDCSLHLDSVPLSTSSPSPSPSTPRPKKKKKPKPKPKPKVAPVSSASSSVNSLSSICSPLLTMFTSLLYVVLTRCSSR